MIRIETKERILIDDYLCYVNTSSNPYTYTYSFKDEYVQYIKKDAHINEDKEFVLFNLYYNEILDIDSIFEEMVLGGSI